MKKIWVLILTIILFFPEISRAEGELLVTYQGLPISGPVFDVQNMMPGDNEEREIVVTNQTADIQNIRVVVTRTGPDGQNDPKLETAIDFSVWENNSILFGPEKLVNFFNHPHGLALGLFLPNQTRTFVFKATLPFSTPNAYQEKQVIFDLLFGMVERNLVINEVYYQVDQNHGFDSLLDRNISRFDNWFIWEYKPGCDLENLNNINTCPLQKTDLKNLCTAPNPFYKPKITDRFYNLWYKNAYWCDCQHRLKSNDEWIEIYNPTGRAVPLNNWMLQDNSFLPTLIRTTKSIPAHGFALISQNASTWNYWPNKNALAVVIELGKPVGNGLGNSGDHLILKNPRGTVVDKVGWGRDKWVWDPAISFVDSGASISRSSPGLDTDTIFDWIQFQPPTPGY